jgi:uncharacterized lipoprotein YmbA
MFDLHADPFEMKNLWNDPAHAELQKQLLAEFDRQQSAVAFVMPPNVDTPKPTDRYF